MILANSVRVFKCPSDKIPAANGPRTRTISINGMVGDPGRLANQFNQEYIQFRKFSDVITPASLFVFLDEHPDSINDGYFHNDVDTYFWSDLPASYHNGACCLSFADGHSEVHNWTDRETKRPVLKNSFEPFPVSSRRDFDWLKERI